MSATSANAAPIRKLLRLATAPGGSSSDRELLARFVLDRSEDAFAQLVARHGPMVLAVCRRQLRDPHAADDAFQAAFLVLARRAGAVRWRESIGGWLFEVASRVARKAAMRQARLQQREGAPAAAEPAAPPAPQTAPADLTALQAALDDELQRLPERLRLPVVLCHLEGLPHDDVARHLAISDGQLRGRLYRAKEKLRARLTRRGFSLTAVLLALALGPRSQALPPLLAADAVRIALARDCGLIPMAVSELARGVIVEMSHSLKLMAAAVLCGVLGLGTAAATRETPREDLAPLNAASAVQPQREAANARMATPQPDDDDEDKKKDPDAPQRVPAKILSVDAAKNSIRVRPDDDEQGIPEQNIVLAAPIRLTFAGQPVAVSELRAGMRCDLVYKGSSTTLLEVRARWPQQDVRVRTVDVAAGSLVILTGDDDDDDQGSGFEVTLGAKDAAVEVDGLKAGLADVPAGRKVSVELGLDKKSIVRIAAEGDPADLPALIQSYNPTTQTLTVVLEVEQGDAHRKVTIALPVNADAKVRYAGRDAKLADLKERMPARVKFSADRKAVVGLLVADPLPIEKDDD